MEEQAARGRIPDNLVVGHSPHQPPAAMQDRQGSRVRGGVQRKQQVQAGLPGELRNNSS